jgi:transposase
VLIIGTWERFPCGKQIGNYVGMIPSKNSSAGKQRLGHIGKQGSSLLRFLLMEPAQAAARVHPGWRLRYVHLANRFDSHQLSKGRDWEFSPRIKEWYCRSVSYQANGE